jgi:putative peptidoglycan lipid II flippase
MKKTAILIMVVTVIAKTFGFARDITLSYFYGATNISDAYIISTTIPILIFAFIGTGILTGYIPMYSNIQQNFGENEGNKFTNNLMNILIVMSSIIIVLGISFTEQIVKIFATGFEGNTLAMAVQFTKISLFSMLFSGLVYIFSGFLQIKGNYIVPAIVSLPMNIIIIFSIFVSTKTNTLVILIGSVIAIASQLALIVPFAYKKGYRYKYSLDIKDEHIKKMAYIALPIIVGVSVDQINILIDRTLASQIAIGGISALNYANRLILFIQGIFVLAITTAMYPLISKMALNNNIKGLKKSIMEAITAVNILIIPVTLGALLFAEPVVVLLFGRGAFDSQAILLTTSALFFYSIGMIGFGLREVLSRAFYSMQDTKTPVMNAAIGMVLNIILNIILSRYLGIGGLALATSIAAIITTILLFISLRKKIGPFGMKQISISFIKILSASLIMGGLAKLSFNYLAVTLSQNLSLIVAIVIGAISYFVIIYFMKIEDVNAIVNAIKMKLGKAGN